MPGIRRVPAYTEATATDAEMLLNALDDKPRQHLEVMTVVNWPADRFYCAMNLLLHARLAELTYAPGHPVYVCRKTLKIP